MYLSILNGELLRTKKHHNSTVFKITRQSLALDSEVHASKGESLLFFILRHLLRRFAGSRDRHAGILVAGCINGLGATKGDWGGQGWSLP